MYRRIRVNTKRFKSLKKRLEREYTIRYTKVSDDAYDVYVYLPDELQSDVKK